MKTSAHDWALKLAQVKWSDFDCRRVIIEQIQQDAFAAGQAKGREDVSNVSITRKWNQELSNGKSLVF